jgi:glycosyltransferase involved in cell wall biosynthesis
MRIGISALFRASGGSLTHLRRLLADWDGSGVLERHELVVFASPSTEAALVPSLGSSAARIRWRIAPASDRGPLFRLFSEHVWLPREARREELDCLFCPANVVPAGITAPSVVLFQNAAPFCESVTLGSVGFSYWLRFRLLGVLMRLSARRASSVIFISAFFRDLFASRFRFDATRSVVIHRAREGRVQRVEADKPLEERLGIRRPYALVVSHLNPYKNLVEVVEAFDRARQQARPGPLQLVIVGRRNHAAYARRLLRTIARLGLGRDGVCLPGELPHEEVQKLVAGCELYVFPSTCENCPTALIEALDLGVPIACSNVGVMPEIGGDAVLYFDPDDVEDAARSLAALATDEALRGRLRAAARERAKVFPDGARVASETIAVLEAAARCVVS